MKNFNVLSNSKMYDGDVCLIDNATTHNIFWDKKYLLNLNLAKVNVNTISNSTNLIEDSERADVTLSGGTNIMSKMHLL